MIKPVWNRVLVKANDIIQSEEKTLGGIYIPEGTNYKKDTHRSGRVVAVGNGPEVSEHLNVGDRVIFGLHNGLDVAVGGEEYKLFDYFELLAKEE